MRLHYATFLCLFAVACAAPEAQVRPPQADLAITHVGVVDARNNEVAPDRTVLIRAGRIIRVGPADETRYLGKPRVVDGTGKYLIPGLLDIVASRTKISSAVVSPFKGRSLGPSVREQQLRTEAPAYLVACGLALRRFG